MTGGDNTLWCDGCGGGPFYELPIVKHMHDGLPYEFHSWACYLNWLAAMQAAGKKVGASA